MDFKELVLKNKETILKDIIAETGMDAIKNLSLTNYEETTYYGNSNCELTSNFLDKSLGLMSNNFTEVYAEFDVTLMKQENNIIKVSGDLRYHHKNGGSNGTSIMNKEGSRELCLLYKIIEDTLVLQNAPFKEGVIKLVVSSDEVSDKVKIGYDEKRMEWELVDILKDMIKSKISIKDVKFYIFDGKVFIDHKPNETLYALVKDVVYKKKYTTLERY